jgi:hypothetical protein
MVTIAYKKDDLEVLYQNTYDLCSQWTLISHID